jgi:hypothetical protein
MEGQLGIGLLYPAGLGSRAGFRRLTFRGRYLGVQSYMALPRACENYKKVQKQRLATLRKCPEILGRTILYSGKLH